MILDGWVEILRMYYNFFFFFQWIGLMLNSEVTNIKRGRNSDETLVMDRASWQKSHELLRVTNNKNYKHVALHLHSALVVLHGLVGRTSSVEMQLPVYVYKQFCSRFLNNFSTAVLNNIKPIKNWHLDSIQNINKA